MALSKHWLKHIEAWQRSNLTQASYCRQHGLNANSFSGRLSELRSQGGSGLPKLIPVQVKGDTQPTLTLGPVLTVQGSRLELPVTVSAQWLAELLRCLN